MKTLIVAAFLVASVASQGMDIPRQVTMDWYNPLMNVRPMRTEMDMPMHYSMDTMDTTYGRCMGGRCLTFEELMSHPLFHSYLRLPLFRMLLERHPMTMRKFVESPLFQNYWMNPEFRMYFRNPVLFYKYIMPLINIVSTNMYSDVDTTTSTPWTTPYSYNPYRRQFYPMSRDTMSCGFRCRYLLNKINNRMGNMGMDRYMGIGNNREMETLTDVKMLPNGRVMEQTFGKVVDPFTGEDKLTTGDMKTFHETIVPVVPEMMTTFIQSTDITQKIDSIIRNHYDIMTREILRNIFGSEEAITAEQYNEVRAILKNQKNNVIPRLERVLRERKTVTPEMKEELYTILREHKKRVIPEIISAVLGSRPITPVMYNKVDQVLEKHHRLIVREIVREIFGVEIPLTMDEEVFTPYPMF